MLSMFSHILINEQFLVVTDIRGKESPTSRWDATQMGQYKEWPQTVRSGGNLFAALQGVTRRAGL